MTNPTLKTIDKALSDPKSVIQDLASFNGQNCFKYEGKCVNLNDNNAMADACGSGYTVVGWDDAGCGKSNCVGSYSFPATLLSLPLTHLPPISTVESPSAVRRAPLQRIATGVATTPVMLASHQTATRSANREKSTSLAFDRHGEVVLPMMVTLTSVAADTRSSAALILSMKRSLTDVPTRAGKSHLHEPERDTSNAQKQRLTSKLW